MDSTKCACNCNSLERVHYFSRQLITADDMTTEQQYFREKLRRHNLFMHGWGVVCGCEVKAASDQEHPWRVQVCPGYVIGPQGDEIMVAEPIYFDLAGDWLQPHNPCARPWPCPPTGTMPAPGRQQPVYLAIRFAECDSRPVRVHPMGCACDDADCEYSRIRDDFELALLWELPECYEKIEDGKKDWGKIILGERREEPALPLCLPCCDTPWVVLAGIHLPDDRKTLINDQGINYAHRIKVYSTWFIEALINFMMMKF
jgi:hypothetical protein